MKTYENSQGYREQKQKSRRVMISPSKFRDLDFEDAEVKTRFLEALGHLKNKGIIDYSWVPFEEGNLVKRIWLIQEEAAINKAYSLTGVTPAYSSYEGNLKSLEDVTFRTYPWVEEFKADLRERFDRTGKFGRVFTGEHDHQRKVIKALISLESREGDPVHERVFSTEVYGDSKEFQRSVKGSLKVLLKRYLDDGVESDEGEVLLGMGLYTNPEIFHFSGGITMELPNGTADFTMFTQGAALPAVYTPSITSISGVSITRVLFIENRATYEESLKTMKPNELIVYHGGFANRRKHEFFKKIAEELPHASFFHWSDFDLGGIRIYTRMKNIIPEIHPYRMSSTELRPYREKGAPLQGAYRRKIKDAMDKGQDPEITEMYRDLLDFGVRLEQENVRV